MEPTVSVVIPSFRGGVYLREAVDSVMAQTYPDWEIIVVSDGSDDPMVDLETRPQVTLIRQENRGAAIARNVGIDRARGRYIALLDEDDRMLPERLGQQVAAMESGAALVHTQFQFIDGESKFVERGVSQDSQYGDFLRTNGKVLLSTTMVRRDVFDEVGGFDPLFKVGQDLHLFYRVARRWRLTFLPEVLTEYRLHESNMWFGSGADNDDVRRILEEHYALALDNNEQANLRAIKEGLRYILPGTAQAALFRAQIAADHKDYVKAAVGVMKAVYKAPGPTVRVLVRGRRKRSATATT